MYITSNIRGHKKRRVPMFFWNLDSCLGILEGYGLLSTIPSRTHANNSDIHTSYHPIRPSKRKQKGPVK